MDPGVRSHGMEADPPGYLWSKYECFLMSGWWDILHSSCFNVKLWSNSMNRTKLRTDKWTNIRTDKRKDENYIPLGINAGGIKMADRITLLLDSKRTPLPLDGKQDTITSKWKTGHHYFFLMAKRTPFSLNRILFSLEGKQDINTSKWQTGHHYLSMTNRIPLPLESFRWDFKPRSHLHDLVVSGTLN